MAHDLLTEPIQPAALPGFLAAHPDTASEDLLRQVAAIVPPYMVPRRVTLIDPLPKNANGKIDRGALLGMADKEGNR